MLSFDDDRWSELRGGYRTLYDPRPGLRRLDSGDNSVWSDLWNGLHHQGDVDLASYAAVPHLVSIHRKRRVADWNTYGLAGAIELCRQEGNPPLPAWLAEGYAAAWVELVRLGTVDLMVTNDETTVRAILGAIGLAKGLRTVATVLLDFDNDELTEMIRMYRTAT